MDAFTARVEIQQKLGFKGDDVDGILGPESLARFFALANAKASDSWPPADPRNVLRGDGTWPWFAEIDGGDIVIRNAKVTCFGGSNDPQDNGETASGASTKDPKVVGCALPLRYAGNNRALRAALGGSPLPMIPWNTPVKFTLGSKTVSAPLIDLGPAKHTGNAGDLTVAAAKLFKPTATATNFKAVMTIRVVGGAQYA